MPRKSNESLEEERERHGYPRDRMTDAEFEDILLASSIDYMEVPARGWRCLLSIFWIFGKRVSEVVELRTADIRVHTYRKASTGESITYLRVPFYIRKKKGGERPMRTKPVTTESKIVKDHILPYVTECKENHQRFLFPRENTKHGHIYERYVWDYIQKLEPKAPIWTHLFRHTRATKMAQLPRVTAWEFQSWFDWSSLAQADAYLSKEGAPLLELGRRIE